MPPKRTPLWTHLIPMAVEQNPIILTYHSISSSPPPLAVSMSQFSEQMEWLSRNARVVPLGDVANTLKHHDPPLTKTVVLTFDDGYQDFYNEVTPQLRRWGFPATVFLPSAYCGRTNSWPGQPRWVDKKPLLTWQQIEEREMIESKREIESHTGLPAEFFCYPYGRWNGRVRDLVSRHFGGACSTAAGIVEPDADPFALPRVDAHYLRNPARF